MSGGDVDPTVEPENGPIIFARIGSPAMDILKRFAGKIRPGAIFPASQEEIASLRNDNDTFVIWRR